jgi:hypothetical protein
MPLNLVQGIHPLRKKKKPQAKSYISLRQSIQNQACATEKKQKKKSGGVCLVLLSL